MDVEQRARELLATAYEADGMGGRAVVIRDPDQYMEKPDKRALSCIIAALTPPECWVLMPRVLTEEMLQAGYPADDAQTGYEAMIAARPEVKP